MRHQDIDRIQLRRWAAEAGVDERTLLKRLRGEPVRGVAGARCDRVLRDAGINPGALRSEVTL
jgi:hypothetical protein